MSKKRIIFGTLLAVILSSCATKKKDIYLNQLPGKIYTSGHKALLSGDKKGAIVAFESLNSQYPFNASTQQGNVELIYAYYLDE